MTRVPVAGKRVERQPLPAAGLSVSAGAGAFGGLEAEAIKEIGGIVSGIGEIAQRRESALEKAQLEFKERNDKLWADTKIIETQDFIRQSRGAYSQLTGVDSFGITSRFDADLERQKKSILDSAQNEEQKRFYEAKFAAKREAALNTAQSYEVTEFKNTEQATLDSIIENTIRDAGDISGDTTVDLANTQIGLFSLRKSLDDAITRKTAGMPVATAKNVRAEVVSAFHESILNKKVVADAENAQQYYNINKKEILPENREGIETFINTTLIEQESKESASFIVAQESDPVKQTKLVQGMPDKTPHQEAVKQKTKERVNVKQKELKQLAVEQKNRVLDTASDNIIIANSLEEALETIKTLSPDNVTLTPTDIDKLEKQAEGRFKEKTGKIVTDPIVEERTNRKVTTGEIRTPNQYIRETEGKMSSDDLQKNLKFLAQGGEVGNLQEGKMRTKFTEIMGAAPKEDPFLYKLSRDFIVDQIQATGKPPTDTNIDDWMGQALLSGTETIKSGGVLGFFTEDRPLTLIEALEKRSPFTTEITDDEKNNIIADIQAENAKLLPAKRIIVNDETIEIIFLRDEGFTEQQIKRIMGL